MLVTFRGITSRGLTSRRLMSSGLTNRGFTSRDFTTEGFAPGLLTCKVPTFNSPSILHLSGLIPKVHSWL